MTTMESNKEIVEKPGSFGVRHTLAILEFFGIVILYTLRISLSVTIVAMTRNVNSTETDHVLNPEGCPITEDQNYTNVGLNQVPETGEFSWDEETQGIVLSSIFYGAILSNIPGGRAAEYFGGRRVAGAGVLLSALFTILSPFAARISVWGLIFVRFLQGMSDGVIVPAITNTIARWYPADERSKFTIIILSGMRFGTVIAMAVSGWLCDSAFFGGWPSVFYAFGGAGIIWTILWFQFTTDDPRQHRRISNSELEYIVNGCPKKMDRPPVPWLSIFKSKYFWVMALAHIGTEWGMTIFVMELPTYLDKILHFKISNVGLLASLPFLGTWLFGNIFSLVTDRLLVHRMISLLTIRKLATIFSFYGTMIGLISMQFIDCQEWMIIAVFIFSITCTGCLHGGFTSSHVDLSPTFAGTLYGLTNCMASVPRFLAPIVVGVITQGNQTPKAWNIVFLIAAIIYGVTGTIYIAVITTEVQPWNDSKKSDTRRLPSPTLLRR